MSYEPYTCIDCGSEFCPCHLAESGNCILCSHLDGKDFCDCCNWNGVCIYQEFVTNNFKSKPGRKHQRCKVLYKEILEDKILILKISASDKLVSELASPGSFVFLRREDTESNYDTPISIMENDGENSTLTFAVELKGLKTKELAKANKDDYLLVKGPFWNGILGVKSILETKKKQCLLIARGIGQAPMISVIEWLHHNENKIITIIDKSPFENIFIKDKLIKYSDKVIECTSIIPGGLLSGKFKRVLEDILNENDISIVHCDAADILNYQIMRIVEAHDKDIKFSCSNNEKMCCGEGVCGCCTRINNDDKLRRLCKIQTEPKYILEGRRTL